MKKKPTAIDLFCGAGGLTEGLRRAGFRVLAGVENDKLAKKVYSLNHPDVTLFGNIKWISGRSLVSKLGLKPGELDLLAGCPPCQGFSSVRTLNGSRKIVDPQNDLIFQFLRIVKTLRPKAIMLENVPGLASDRRFAKFISKLDKWGYKVKHSVLNAADYGVPQRRRRLIMLAGMKGKIRFAPRAKREWTVRDAIAGLPPAGNSGDEAHDIAEQRAKRIQRLISKVPKDGGSRTDLSGHYRLECHKNCSGFKDVYGRMAWDKAAPTLTTGCYNPSKGRFLHPQEDRAITIREAALLQTFSRKYKLPAKVGKERLSSFIGNALPPEFVRRHAKSVQKYLKASAKRSKKKRR